jgi:hypothetical protein
MMTVKIYEHAAELPEMGAEDFFHSATLMALLEQTPRQKPLMAVVRDEGGRVAGHMLVSVRYRSSWFPPYLYRHCIILGEGVYQDESPDPLGALNGERIADHIADIMGDEIGLCDLQGVQHPCNVACLRLLVEATGRL